MASKIRFPIQAALILRLLCTLSCAVAISASAGTIETVFQITDSEYYCGIPIGLGEPYHNVNRCMGKLAIDQEGNIYFDGEFTAPYLTPYGPPTGIRKYSQTDSSMSTLTTEASGTPAVDANGDIYAINNCFIYKVSATDGAVSTVYEHPDRAREGYCPDTGGVDGISQASSIALHGSYLYTTVGARILPIDLSTPSSEPEVMAGNMFDGFSGDGGPLAQASLLGSHSYLAFDGYGNLYINQNVCIRKITERTGIITTIAGDCEGNIGFSGDGGHPLRARISADAIAVDSRGNLYFADAAHHRVRKISASGNRITTVAGTGGWGFSGDGGRAANAQLFHPTAVAADAAGNLYISDAGNARVRKVTFKT